jgi:hypothetical protein
MKTYLILFSITIAFLAIAFKDTLLLHFETIQELVNNTNTTSFKGLPLLPPRAISGARKSANMTVSRAIRKAFLAIEQSEGAGARVRRSIGTPQLRNFSPFLMLDHFTSSPGSGFPDHPRTCAQIHGFFCEKPSIPRSNNCTNLYSQTADKKPSPTSCKAQ